MAYIVTVTATAKSIVLSASRFFYQWLTKCNYTMAYILWISFGNLSSQLLFVPQLLTDWEVTGL